ncbi:MAG: RluA family pseudouridine synthase [Thiotrichales bacterium]|nr:RluA family pseudouridine synthase [Thiotrichales bacterium]
MNEKFISVQHVTVDNEDSGRRIDNFLFARLKRVPKTRIYRMLRKGEVRINGRRVRQDRKLEAGDVVRIPPVHSVAPVLDTAPVFLQERLGKSIIYEDERILAVNKPAGISVHSGSRDSHGVIEALRSLRPDEPGLQLAHRLDRMTSGCLLLCKDNATLREIHQRLRQGQVRKFYQALVMGHPGRKTFEVQLALRKGQLRGGERMVTVDATGKMSKSVFRQVRRFKRACLMEIELHTGRTHQIRVHASESGHPLAMDRKYGDTDFNRRMKGLGLKRMFLHANRVEFSLDGGKPLVISAELPGDLDEFLQVRGL